MRGDVGVCIRGDGSGEGVREVVVWVESAFWYRGRCIGGGNWFVLLVCGVLEVSTRCHAQAPRWNVKLDIASRRSDLHNLADCMGYSNDTVIA